MFNDKLLKMKKYLKENLRKSFISFSTTFYVSSMLFVIKLNNSLKFCVNYKKLNVVTRRNRYFISLIDEILVRVTSCKYLIKLNIIAAFNKLRMHLDNENYTIFVIFMNAYKYHVLFFKLINESINYQHYMNDVLFEYLNKFY